MNDSLAYKSLIRVYKSLSAYDLILQLVAFTMYNNQKTI